MTHPIFPDWLQDARIIGRNADGENLAVGRNDNGVTWLGRLNHHNGSWSCVRVALQKEIDDYDNQFLAEMCAMGRDCRTVEPPEWRLL